MSAANITADLSIIISVLKYISNLSSKSGYLCIILCLMQIDHLVVLCNYFVPMAKYKQTTHLSVKLFKSS